MSIPDVGEVDIGPEVGDVDSNVLSDVVESVNGLKVAVVSPVLVVVEGAGAAVAATRAAAVAIAAVLSASAPAAQSAIQRFPRVDLVIESPLLQSTSTF